MRVGSAVEIGFENFKELITGVGEMRKSKFMLSSWLVMAAVMVSGASYAAGAGNAANGKTIFTQGKGAAAPCASCHGENAMGNDAMGAPRLANLGSTYVVKQLNDLANDKRVPEGAGAVMPMFAKELNDQDRRDVSAYVNSLEAAKPELSDLKALKEAGEPVGNPGKGNEIVNFGVTGKVPACQGCHQYNGRGAAPLYPQIAQQKYTYLVNQLKAWRAGTRANDSMGQMRQVAKNLTDEDIANVSAYLSQARLTTSGNSRVPENAKY